MKTYKVGQITFTINHNNNPYLINNLNNYEVSNEKANHHLDVEFVDEIVRPIGNIVPNSIPKEIISDDQRIIFGESKGGIKVLISHDHEYRYVKLLLNKQLIKEIERMEYIYLGIIFLEISLKYRYLPLHGSALISNNNLFIISAPSGTGKSTMRNHFSKLDQNLIVLNDDKPILNFEDDIYVYGQPFSGEDVLNSNLKIKLNSIIFLKQGLENKFNQLSDETKIVKILENIYKPKYEEDWDLVLKQVEQLVETVKIVEFEAINDISAAVLINDFLKQLNDN